MDKEEKDTFILFPHYDTTGTPTTGYLQYWANRGEKVNPFHQVNREFKWECREM